MYPLNQMSDAGASNFQHFGTLDMSQQYGLVVDPLTAAQVPNNFSEYRDDHLAERRLTCCLQTFGFR